MLGTVSDNQVPKTEAVKTLRRNHSGSWLSLTIVHFKPRHDVQQGPLIAGDAILSKRGIKYAPQSVNERMLKKQMRSHLQILAVAQFMVLLH